MNYSISIIEERGYSSAMLGLSLSYNRPVSEMYSIARKIYKEGSHGKFLESIYIWLDLTMPRYFWSEFDTYRVGITKQSASTMHTIFKQELTQDDFTEHIDNGLIYTLNKLIEEYNLLKELGDEFKIDLENIFKQIKNHLPEGFLQRRIVCTNYKTLRNIISQRKNHRLEEWQELVKILQNECKYKEFLI